MTKTSARDAVMAAVRDSVPIALGYFTVSMALGVFSAEVGLSAWLAGLMSATSISSSGEFQGLTTIANGGSYLQLAIGVILVNLRYILMSISLAQRLGPQVGTLKRLVIALGVTDEIYALAMSRRQVGFADYLASMVLPIIGWTAGTVIGNLVGGILPPILSAAFSVLLYAMFLAIVIPPAKKSRPVLWVVLGSAALSSALAAIKELDSSWRTIIVTIVIAALAATFLPHEEIAHEEAAHEEETGHEDTVKDAE